MFNPKDVFRSFFPKTVTAFFCIIFGLYVGEKNIPAPEENFTPVLRFTVCSDIHLTGESGEFQENQLRNVISQSYAYSEQNSVYSELDAFVVCGDMTEWGKECEYLHFRSITDKALKDSTRLLCCMGNHEFIEANEISGIDPFENYRRFISENVDTHIIINGYHFIGLSYSDGKETFKGKTAWLKNEIEKAIEDTGDKPVFVYQHPHPSLTVYGSVHWGEISIRRVLSKYKQVINFSGHSHYNAADPRSVYQGSFTAFGTGSLIGLIGNLNYLDANAPSMSDSASYYIIEIDKDGNLRALVFDPLTGKEFPGTEKYIPVGKKPYTWSNLIKADTRPAFPDDAAITTQNDSNGDTVLTFPEAEGYYPAQSYNITLCNSKGKTVFSESFPSGYIHSDNVALSVNLGKLECGEYRAIITPVSPYYKNGHSISTEFVI